ncbi:AAA family ATPase, partial [Klebsiella pneumoniae]|nr:AAA family ATPase [Klebsiella pneumoniae]
MTTDITHAPTAQDAHAALTALRAEIGKAVVGNDNAIMYLVLALLC